jgi:tRNA dimethylallyltransferase
MFVILGPTSSGKSDYAIKLAKEVDGEIISVDSRQVYRGMDIGTGKVPRDRRPTTDNRRPSEEVDPSAKSSVVGRRSFVSSGVRHHLLNVTSPKREYNVTHFLRDAKKAITDIERRGKVPILCGGTTFWAEALLLGTNFPEVKPDKALRARLGRRSAEELFAMLEEKDPERAETIDPHNKIRLIRALEIVASLGKVPANQGPSLGSKRTVLDGAKIIILNPPKEILHDRIEKRLKERLEQGMIDEVKRLREEGVSWKRLEGFGLEYRWCARFLQGKISSEEMRAELLKDSKHYAKRQLTFLRRLERSGFDIEWKRS